MLAVAEQFAFLARLGPEEALPALRDVVSQGRCASLRFSDVHEAAEALLEVLT